MGCAGHSKVASAKKPKATSVTPELTNPHAGEDIRDKYDFGEMLGSGSFGQVREATLKSQPSAGKRAVKMIERDNEDGAWSNQAIFVREVGLLQNMNHENIIRYYDFYEDVHFLYVVMELCKGGEVFGKLIELRRFSERNAAILGRQMLRAMDYIHKLKITHRDIKAENFMLSEPDITSQVKMIDFGMATRFEDNQVLTELCGSPHYLAPELIGQKYTHQVDVWAFGVLLYLIVYGHYPHDAKHPRDIMVKILTEPIRWQTKVKLSKDGLQFLKALLEPDPKRRLTAEKALEHKWIERGDSALQDASEISTEVLRSAHKKVTSTRKPVDPKVEEQRNFKLKKIDEDFSRGIRHGTRLGKTPTEEFMNRPEFVRRENKITTAPSRNRSSDSLGGPSPLSALALLLKGDDEEKAQTHAKLGQVAPFPLEIETPAPVVARKDNRAASAAIPRRLSYIGALSKPEENTFADLYKEKKILTPTLGIVPDHPQEDSSNPPSPGLPQTDAAPLQEDARMPGQ